jgi:endoglucanase
MGATAFLASTVVLGASPAAPATTASHATTNGFRVVGNRILDSRGATFTVHGVARPSLEWSCQGQALDGSSGIPPVEYVTMRSAWGANTVRLALNEMSWVGDAGLEAWAGCPGYIATVTSTVAAARAAGLVVLLDLHWSDADDHSQAPRQHCSPDISSLRFWRSVAATFKGDAGVWFELYNEPHGISWSQWRDGGPVTCEDGTVYESVGMQALLDAVRAAGAGNIVVAGGLDWAFDLSGLPEWHLTGTNVAYATHPYVFKPSGTAAWDEAFGAAARYAPVIATEFGRTTCEATDPYDSESLAYFRARGVGYTGWAWWAGSCEFPSLLASPAADCVRAGCAVQADLVAFAMARQDMKYPAPLSWPGVKPQRPPHADGRDLEPEHGRDQGHEHDDRGVSR